MPLSKEVPKSFKTGWESTMWSTKQLPIYFLSCLPMIKERIYLNIWKILGIIFLSVAVINFKWVSIYNHLFFKLIIIYFSIAFIDIYIKEIYWLLEKIKKLSRTWSRIDNIPTKQVFDILMDSNWLPAQKFFEYISTDKDQFKKLWDNLERAGILIRWQKNARILNNQYTAKQILDILNSKSDSDRLHSGLLKISENSYKLIKHRF